MAGVEHFTFLDIVGKINPKVNKITTDLRKGRFMDNVTRDDMPSVVWLIAPVFDAISGMGEACAEEIREAIVEMFDLPDGVVKDPFGSTTTLAYNQAKAIDYLRQAGAIEEGSRPGYWKPTKEYEDEVLFDADEILRKAREAEPEKVLTFPK